MKLSWNWICDYVPAPAPVEKVAERLTMSGLEVKKIEKIGNDYRLETEITSNRPDWLSHIGVAREIAALYGRALRIPKIPKIKRGKTSAVFHVAARDKNLCPFYTGVILEELSLVKTPDEMRARLEVCGLRSINFIVDVTNYVLLESGQPLHAFDIQTLRGNCIKAGKAKTGESITAINGSVYELSSSDCVISDDARPVAIGGVMGGRESEVSDATENILIESAYFVPSAIRKTSRRLKLASDSSYRFERGVDPLGVDWGRERATALIAEFCKPSVVGPVLKSGSLPLQKRKVVLDTGEVPKILGANVAAGKIKKILNQLGIRSTQNRIKLIAQPPSFRADIGQPADLIEEIARIDGYDKIPETMPSISMSEPVPDPLFEIQEKSANLAAGLGLQEVVTFSVIMPDLAAAVDPDESNWVKIENPKNQHLTLMRPHFLVSFLQVVRHNLNVGVSSVSIFETANRYWNTGKELPEEDRALAIAFSGETPVHWMNKTREFNFYHLKGAFEYLLAKLTPESKLVPARNHPFFIPGEAFEIQTTVGKIGAFGTVKSRHLKSFDIERPVFFGEISLSMLAAPRAVRPVFRELDKYPKSKRDLSVVVEDGVQSSQLIGAIQSCGSDLIRSVEVFDVYKGGNIEKGKKSISFRITYQAGGRTLEADEVNRLHFSIVESLSSQFRAKLH